MSSQQTEKESPQDNIPVSDNEILSKKPLIYLNRIEHGIAPGPIPSQRNDEIDELDVELCDNGSSTLPSTQLDKTSG